MPLRAARCSARKPDSCPVKKRCSNQATAVLYSNMEKKKQHRNERSQQSRPQRPYPCFASQNWDTLVRGKEMWPRKREDPWGEAGLKHHAPLPGSPSLTNNCVSLSISDLLVVINLHRRELTTSGIKQPKGETEQPWPRSEARNQVVTLASSTGVSQHISQQLCIPQQQRNIRKRLCYTKQNNNNNLGLSFSPG